MGINTTLAIFLPPVYDFGLREIGFFYFTPVTAVILGELAGHYLHDFIARQYIRTHGGRFEPEVRLRAVAAALLAAGLLAGFGGGVQSLAFLALFGVPVPMLLLAGMRGRGRFAPALPLALLGLWPVAVLLLAALLAKQLFVKAASGEKVCGWIGSSRRGQSSCSSLCILRAAAYLRHVCKTKAAGNSVLLAG